MTIHTSKLKATGILLFAMSFGLAAIAHAQSKPAVYPAKGQSQQKQLSDDKECYNAAKANTGIDPAVTAPPSGPTVAGSQRMGGAARGALGGAAIGAVAGDAGKGAAAGAVVGTMAGGARKRRDERNQQSSNQTFYNSYSACMQARGYSVK